MAKTVDINRVLSIIPERKEDSNKGTFGKILNISGSDNYIGAAYLSSISALRIGAGYVSLYCPESVKKIIATMAPEITYESNIDNIKTYTTISIGCGLSTSNEAKELVQKIIKTKDSNQLWVIDADAINILATIKEEISLKNGVITPHPKELSRLLNVELDEILNNKEKYARITSKKYDCITILKGHNTIITDGEEIYINPTGNSALAKAGSGDVLTGIIAGLMAQGVNNLDAAIAGAYIHGLAGDIASEDLTQYGVLASDVVDYIPDALLEIFSQD